MIELTRAAARQVRDSTRDSGAEEFALRIFAQRMPDGAIEYKMGFDEVGVEDVLYNSRGVDVVFARAQKELISGTVLDYVEIEPGSFRFIFMNPNDPHYRPPAEE